VAEHLPGMHKALGSMGGGVLTIVEFYLFYFSICFGIQT
jgi:hypothetical protein